MIFGLLVNEAVTRETRLINILFDNPVFRFFGKISYGFYIFHWPLYFLLSPWLFEQLAGSLHGAWLQFFVSLSATLIAIAVSWTSFTFFESYFLKLKKKYSS
jgi:peptidoglycan/LPS O-acetylase OafA/YrhL